MVLAACTAFAADSSLLSLVSPDTKVIAGIHVDRTTASQFGQFLLSQAQHGDADFNKFVAATGFDPRREQVIQLGKGGLVSVGIAVHRGTVRRPFEGIVLWLERRLRESA